MKKLTDVSGLTLTGDELLVVAERNQPSLTTQRAHLPNVIDIDERVSMNSPETSVGQALLKYLKRLRGKVLPLGCDDPDELTLGLECVNLILAEQEIFAAKPTDDPLYAPR